MYRTKIGVIILYHQKVITNVSKSAVLSLSLMLWQFPAGMEWHGLQSQGWATLSSFTKVRMTRGPRHALPLSLPASPLDSGKMLHKDCGKVEHVCKIGTNGHFVTIYKWILFIAVECPIVYGTMWRMCLRTEQRAMSNVWQWASISRHSGRQSKTMAAPSCTLNIVCTYSSIFTEYHQSPN